MGNSGVKVQTRTDRALEKLLLEQKRPLFLICSTERGQAYSDAAVADGDNTGNGTVDALSVGEAAAKNETFTLICTLAGGAGVAKFGVTGSVSGAQAEATDGTPYTSDGGEVLFTVNAGGVDWALGDKFTIATTATKINVPTSVASLGDFDDWYGAITSGGNISLADVAFKTDDLARAMVVTAIKNGAPGGLFVVSAKAHGVTRGAVSNAEYQAAIDACTPYQTKLMVHESIDEADQIDLAQFAFEQSTPDTAKFTYAFFSLGAAQSLATYTTRAANIDGGVARGTWTEEPTPYSVVSPAAIDENGNASQASAVAHAVAYACFRAFESDPAMPIVSFEPIGFGGLEKDWLDGTTSEHDQLNDNGVSTSKTRGSRIVIHRVVTCIQNLDAQSKQYMAWHDEPGVWINYYLKEDLMNIFSSPPYDRTKNTQEIRDLMVGDTKQRLRLMEEVKWPSSRGAGIIENVADHEAEVSFEQSLTDPNQAVGTFVYDQVNALYGINITAYVIV